MRFAFTCTEEELEQKIKELIEAREDKYVYENKTIKHTPGDKTIFVELTFSEKKKEVLHD
jgi:hypothetical protein